MTSRLKTFRWKRFLVAMALTFVAVIVFGKAMAMGGTAAGSQTSKGPGPSAATDITAPAAAGSTSPAAGDPGVLSNSKAAAMQSYYRQVDAIRTDTELVTAKIDNLKAHHELEQAQSGVFSSEKAAAQTSSDASMVQGPLVAPAAVAEPATPVVTQTSMIDGRWIASIRLPSGSYINNLRAGQYIRDVGKIQSISLNDVTVSRGKKTFSLPFAGADGAISNAPTVPSPSAMPFAPPFGIH